MSDIAHLNELLNAPGAPFVNWREINASICDEFGHARTEDQRVALLASFQATMDVAETTVAPESLTVFQAARMKQYKSFIVEEALVRGQVCVETLHAVTSREISAGRMAPNNEMRKIAEAGVAVPHHRRAELLAGIADPPVAPEKLWHRIKRWLRNG